MKTVILSDREFLDQVVKPYFENYAINEVEYGGEVEYTFTGKLLPQEDRIAVHGPLAVMSDTIDRLERQNKEQEAMLQMYEELYGKIADRDKSVEMTQQPGFKKSAEELKRKIEEAQKKKLRGWRLSDGKNDDSV